MKRLRDVQRDEQRDQRVAQRWADEHDVGNMPGARSETGESSGKQSVGHSGDPSSMSRGANDDLPRKHRDDVSYSGFASVDDFEQWMLEQGGGYLALVGGGEGHPTMATLEKRARMNHVLSYMDPNRVELLYWKFIEAMTLEEIAVTEGVSKQAISKRLKVASDEFMREFAEHWNDDTPWEV